ncbi:MAG: type II toxin-antitoxin system YafQ family toxin [Chitinivibrionia bacterium]|nr:type II toxin-antitoxin system YafQ family toxin [Chitinivibrionia bacterium]
MLEIKPTEKFEKDIDYLNKKRRNMDELKKAIILLAEQKPIPPKYKDHQLSGEWKQYRELHITWKPDWLLIYRIFGNQLILQRTGSHDDLFM